MAVPVNVVNGGLVFRVWDECSCHYSMHECLALFLPSYSIFIHRVKSDFTVHSIAPSLPYRCSIKLTVLINGIDYAVIVDE